MKFIKEKHFLRFTWSKIFQRSFFLNIDGYFLQKNHTVHETFFLAFNLHSRLLLTVKWISFRWKIMVLTRFSCLMSYSNEHLKFLKSDFKNLRDESDQSGVTSRQGKIGNISFFSLIYTCYWDSITRRICLAKTLLIRIQGLGCGQQNSFLNF